MEDIQYDFTSTKTELETSTKSLLETKTALREANEKLEEKTRQVVSLEEQYKNLQHDVRAHKIEHFDNLLVINEAKQKLSDVTAELNCLREDAEKRSADLTKELKTREEECQLLKHKCETLSILQKNKLAGTTELDKTVVNAKTDELESLKEAFAASVKDAAEAKSQLAKASVTNDEQTKALEKKEAELSKWKNKFHQMRKKSAELKQELDLGTTGATTTTTAPRDCQTRQIQVKKDGGVMKRYVMVLCAVPVLIAVIIAGQVTFGSGASITGLTVYTDQFRMPVDDTSNGSVKIYDNDGKIKVWGKLKMEGFNKLVENFTFEKFKLFDRKRILTSE